MALRRISTPTAIQVPSAAGLPGAVNLGTDGNNSAYLSLGAAVNVGLITVGDTRSFKVRLRPLSITNIKILLGLGADISSGTFGSRGMFFRLDLGTDANWRSVSREPNTESVSTATRAATTGSQTSFEFVQASSTLWHCYLTNAGARAYFSSHTANLATGSLALGVYVQALAGTAKSCDIDLIETGSLEYTLR